jgi:hypothetical protein
MKINHNKLVDEYKSKPGFKVAAKWWIAAVTIWAVVLIIKVGISGFEFGQWLRAH